MAKKSKRKTSVKSSLLVLLLILILLISSTYAWFTANTKVTISSLDVKVSTANGLQISTDATNWKTFIDVNDIKTGYEDPLCTNQLPVTMIPVSTAKDVAGGKLKLFKGSLEPNAEPGINKGKFQLTSVAATEEKKGDSGQFISFDVFLKVTEATSVYLTSDSNVTFKPTTDDKGLQNATRVAFLDEGNALDGQEPITYQQLNSYKGIKIWEPNADQHTAPAIQNAKNALKVVSPEGRQPTIGIKQAISEPILIDKILTPDKTNLVTVTNDFITNQGEVTSKTHEVMQLQPGVTKVKLYLWVEGQDIDCENSASGSDIRFDIGFEIFNEVV